MLESQDIGHGITCIDTGYLRPGMTACYLLQHNGAAALIETGVNHNVPGILDLLDRLNIGRQQVEYVMPTHVHLDHAGGVGALMQALPAARLVMHPRGARHMTHPFKLAAGAKAVYGEEKFHAMYGELIPVDEARVDIAEDNHEIDFHGRRLVFLDTPGHARHHYCIVDETSRGVFTGDTMGLSYPELNGHGHFAFPTTTPVQFDPPALHASIDHIMQFDPARLYLTHYGCVEQVETHVAQLHHDIDAFVDMQESVLHSESPEQELTAHMDEYLVERAMHAGCSLSRMEAVKFLEMDIKLNVQGLLHWSEYSKNH